MPDLWERQPRESAKAFGAFVMYRDLPASERSLVKVAQKLAKSDGTVARWSTRFAWVARAEAHDDEQDRHKRAAQTKAVEQMAERHAAQAQLAIQAFLRRLQDYRTKRPEDDPERMDFELKTIDVDGLYRMVVRAGGVLPDLMDLERKSRGQPTEVHGFSARPAAALEQMTDEERMARVTQIAAILHETGALKHSEGALQPR